MRRRKKPSEALSVTSFRLPQDVRVFLRDKALVQQRSMSWVLVEYFRRWIQFEEAEAKQPGKKK